MTREEAFRAGFENPLIGANAPLQRLYGTISALGEELGGADMGTPVGTKFREKQAATKSEVKRLQKLREQFPEEFGRGQMQAQEQADPYMLGLGLSPFGMRPGVVSGERMLPGAGGRAMLPRGGIMEGEVLSPLPQIEGPLYDLSKRNAPMSPQTSQFERNAVSAMQVRPRGFGYGYQAPSYFEEGGQGFRPSIEDFVPVEVRRNPQEFYDQTAMDQMAAEMQAGNRQAFRNPIYGPNANRPNYGVAPEGYVSPFERMPAPGVRKPIGMPGPAPFGEGAEGKGYFGNMPNPGVRSGVRQEIGQDAGMPRLRYEPVGPVGTRSTELPVMAQSTPRLGYERSPIDGDFYEVYGIGGPRSAQEAPYAGSMDFGVTRDGQAVPPSGMRFDPRLAAAAFGGGAGFGAGYMSGGDRDKGTLPPFSPNIPVSGQRVGMSEMYPVIPMGATALSGQMPGAGTAFDQPAVSKAKGKKIEVKKAKGAAQIVARPQELTAESQFEPNLNYLVTQALDRLLGQGEAERGRQYQQDVEKYQRQYGPIYY